MWLKNVNIFGIFRVVEVLYSEDYLIILFEKNNLGLVCVCILKGLCLFVGNGLL